MKLPSEPYRLSEKDYARIERHKTLRMYQEISQMLEIYYPGFWQGVTDEETKLAWVAQAHQIAKKYNSPRMLRGVVEITAQICAIIGLDFESKPKFEPIVNKMKTGSILDLISIIDYLRFEVLRKDYDVGGTQYNSWSLRDVGVDMPPITRHVPSFYTERKPKNPNENVRKIYDNYLKEKANEL